MKTTVRSSARALAVTVVALALVLAACGSSDDSGGSGGGGGGDKKEALIVGSKDFAVCQMPKGMKLCLRMYSMKAAITTQATKKETRVPTTRRRIC